MIKNILFTFAFALLHIPGMAQTDAEKKAEITKIKKSSDYIYTEATLPTAEEAKALAEEMLYDEINAWVASQKKLKDANNIIVKDQKFALNEIELPRGNMFRAFVYVKKSDIIGAESSVTLQEQKKESPKTPVAATPTPSKSEQIPAAIQKVVNAKKFSELKPLFTALEQEGSITEYNLYSALQDPAPYYLVVCNRQQDVVAVLTPEDNGRKNLKTGKVDAADNYNWHGATIAFKVK